MIRVFSTKNNTETYKQKLEKNLDNIPNKGHHLIEYYIKPITVDKIDPVHESE